MSVCLLHLRTIKTTYAKFIGEEFYSNSLCCGFITLKNSYSQGGIAYQEIQEHLFGYKLFTLGYVHIIPYKLALAPVEKVYQLGLLFTWPEPISKRLRVAYRTGVQNIPYSLSMSARNVVPRFIIIRNLTELFL